MAKFAIILFIAIFMIVVSTMPTNAAITPHKHERQSSKERVKDGIYMGKDSHHEKNGKHNVEFDHEAIIGNVREALEFDTLPPEESKRRLGILLKMMDINGDEHIDRHELRIWIIRSFKKLSEEETSDRFEEVDQDNDDKITWKEYLMDAYSMETENFRKELIDFDSYEEEHKMMQDDKEMFAAADMNGDGVLNVSEFLYFLYPEENPQMLPTVLEHTMRDKDLNNDGKIDFQEFIGEMGTQRDKEWLIAEKDNFDAVLDLNQDGVLTGAEVLAWVLPSNENIAKDEVDHLFAASDDDHDDLLSFSEILHNYELFVGSEVTDYGDHLQNIHRLNDEL